MENTVNKLFDFTFWTDDTIGPYKTGFQKQPLEHTQKISVSFQYQKTLRNIV